MPAEWNELQKPTDTWGILPKPNNTIVTTITSTPHTSGKFMGILGLTYPGVEITTTSSVSSGWNELAKPNNTWAEILKPQT